MNYVLQGMAMGLPWNALLVATDLYRTNIATRDLASVESLLTVVYLSCNLASYAYLNRPGGVRVESKEDEAKYVRVYYLVNLVSFLIMSVTPHLPSQVSRDESFFAILMTIGAMTGATSAFSQHALFAFAARDGPTCTQGYLLGFAFSGTVAASFSAFIGGVSNAQMRGTFIFALVELFLILGAFTFVYRMQPRIYQRLVVEIDADDAESSEDVEHQIIEPVAPTNSLSMAVAVVAITLAGTLFVFPGLISSFKPVSESTMEAEFTLVLFLMFNLGDTVGRLLSSYFLTFVSDATLVGLVVIRSSMLAFFALCNRESNPDSSHFSDSITIQLTFFQAVASGMLFAEGASRAPKASPHDPGRAGKIVATSIAVALAVGAAAGSILVHLI